MHATDAREREKDPTITDPFTRAFLLLAPHDRVQGFLLSLFFQLNFDNPSSRVVVKGSYPYTIARGLAKRVAPASADYVFRLCSFACFHPRSYPALSVLSFCFAFMSCFHACIIFTRNFSTRLVSLYFFLSLFLAISYFLFASSPLFSALFGLLAPLLAESFVYFVFPSHATVTRFVRE